MSQFDGNKNDGKSDRFSLKDSGDTTDKEFDAFEQLEQQ
jgi:hypothetical protein